MHTSLLLSYSGQGWVLVGVNRMVDIGNGSENGLSLLSQIEEDASGCNSS